MSYGGTSRGDRPSAPPADLFPSPAARQPDEISAPRQRVAGHRRARPPRRGGPQLPGWWPVAVVLAAQALLSLRLVGADTAFEDEAAYLWAGHLEWSHWLHGTPVPHFPAYFSGAPVIYPPLAALADSLGGLAAARGLSLIFMLGVTLLLWATASRLAGRRAGFFASALFAVAAPTLHLGSFATYDALSLLLTSLAAWLVVRAAVRPAGDADEPAYGGDGTGWMAIAGVCLALANATAYTSVLLDPVVIALALVTGFPRPGGKVAAIRVATITVVTAVLLTAGALAGGSFYLTGITSTTLARVAGTDSPLTVLQQAWSWTGLVVVAALCGVALSFLTAETAPRRWLLGLLTLAALIIPAEQARLHTTDSLAKHLDVGLWFAAIAAGYAVDKLIAAAPAATRHRAVTASAAVVALAFPVTLGASQASALATAWPNSTSLIAILGPLVNRGTGHLLVEDPSIAEYYLPGGRDWERWSSTRNITLPDGASTGGPAASAGVTGPGNAGTFAEYLTEGYFSLVALNFADTTALDHKLAADLRRNHRYRLIQVIPYGTGTYVLWRYEPRS